MTRDMNNEIERRRSTKSSKRDSTSHHHAPRKDPIDHPSSSLAAKLEKEHDNNGCCTLHPHVQIAKRKLMGWKILRSCPACNGEEVGLDDDRLSVSSNRSGKSNRSSKSGRGRQSSRKEAVEPQYDAEGYCCLHPAVRVAKKKTMGGWKLLVDVCPDCERERSSLSKSRRRSLSQRRRSVSRPRDEEDTRSVSSSLSRHSNRSNRGPRKVKDLKIRDQNRVPGRYSGYVDGNSKPDGKGVIRYENGMEWSGLWCEGEQVQGKMRGYQSKF